jgi:hypothetical protein
MSSGDLHIGVTGSDDALLDDALPDSIVVIIWSYTQSVGWSSSDVLSETKG